MAGGPSDVLIVVDVQTDFCPGGRLAVPGGDEVVMPINRIAAGFAHVVLTQDWHPAGHHSFASSHPGRAPFETVTARLRPAGAVAGPLRTGKRRRRLSPRARCAPCRACAAQGLPPRDRFLFGLLRERPHHPDGARRATCASAAWRGSSSPASPSISACAGRPKTPAASASRRSSSRTPAGESTSTARSLRRGRALRSAAWCAWGRGRWGKGVARVTSAAWRPGPHRLPRSPRNRPRLRRMQMTATR